MAHRTREHEKLPHHDRYIYGEGDIELNKGRRKTSLTIRNTGDRAVQICSHYHFFEVNPAISFDRDAAYGMHLDLPAGNAIRIEPGDTREVDLVEYGGGHRVYGFSGLVDGSVRANRTHRVALDRLDLLGFLDTRGEESRSANGAERPAGKASQKQPAAARAAKGTAASGGRTVRGKAPATKTAARTGTSGRATSGKKG
ncbi:urease subunit beta [Streptosporangium saharense]|uniref:urease subunit beta n=1 Tax=Streptosporangium saharense TaxID=1706840 RepID=UPI003EB94E90